MVECIRHIPTGDRPLTVRPGGSCNFNALPEHTYKIFDMTVHFTELGADILLQILSFVFKGTGILYIQPHGSD